MEQIDIHNSASNDMPNGTAHWMKLDILSPERRLVEGAIVEVVTLTTSEGQIQILPGHAPMMGYLEPGVFQYKIPGKESVEGFISTGFFEIQNYQIKLMAETLELKDEIDLIRAKNAQKKAEETLTDANLDDSQLKKYQLKLQRAIIRQQLNQLK